MAGTLQEVAPRASALTVLQYLHQEGCPWHPGALLYASREVIAWARTKGLPGRLSRQDIEGGGANVGHHGGYHGGGPPHPYYDVNDEMLMGPQGLPPNVLFNMAPGAGMIGPMHWFNGPPPWA